MAFLNMLSAGLADKMHTPSGMWEWLILHLFDFVVNYGWRIVVFTILLKLVLLPLDVYQKHCMRKNQLITERLKPEMEKLQKAYGHDKQQFAQKQMELNKREGFSYFSSCLPMILTMVIFIWLWQSMTTIAQYMMLKQYVEWNDRYTVTESYLRGADEFAADGGATDEDKARVQAYVTAAIENYNKSVAEDAKLSVDNVRPGMAADWSPNGNINDQAVDPIVIEVAGQSVADLYAGPDSNRQSFLWIANVWSPDVPWQKPITNNRQDFINSVSKYTKEKKPKDAGLSNEELQSVLANYDRVTKKLIQQEQKANGYLVLPILSIGFSFLSYFISQRQQKKLGQAPVEGAAGSGAMKVMMFLMPIMMGGFALTYSAAFTLYIVINSSTTIIVNLLSSLILDTKDKMKERQAAVTVQRHGRPDPNAKPGQKPLKIAEKPRKRDPNAIPGLNDKADEKPRKLKKR